MRSKIINTSISSCNNNNGFLDIIILISSKKPTSFRFIITNISNSFRNTRIDRNWSSSFSFISLTLKTKATSFLSSRTLAWSCSKTSFMNISVIWNISNIINFSTIFIDSIINNFRTNLIWISNFKINVIWSK